MNDVINGDALVWEPKAFYSQMTSGQCESGSDISTSCLIISHSACANELEL